MIAQNGTIARQAAEVLEIFIKLVNLNVCKTINSLNMPVCIADIVFSQGVLNQVNLVLDFNGIHLGDDHDLAKLAEEMFLVRMAKGWIIFVFLVHREVLMSFADHQGADNFFLYDLLTALFVFLAVGFVTIGAFSCVLVFIAIVLLVAILSCLLLLFRIHIAVDGSGLFDLLGCHFLNLLLLICHFTNYLKLTN